MSVRPADLPKIEPATMPRPRHLLTNTLLQDAVDKKGMSEDASLTETRYGKDG